MVNPQETVSLGNVKQANELRDHPVFICGHPKAGTSLLRAVLDSHPQLVVYPEETMFFRRTLPQLEGQDLEAQLKLAERNLIHIFHWSRTEPDPSQAGFTDRDYSSIPYNEVRNKLEELAKLRSNHPGDLLSAAVLAYGIAAGALYSEKRHWVEKSPYNEYFADQIFSWWPEARCLHILRDPRDNFNSYRRKHPNWNAEFFSSNWSRSTEAGINNQKNFGADRYWFVRFEDLARSPEEYLSALAIFLDINWDPSLINPTRAGQQWGGNSMFEDQFQSISTAPLYRWKDSLSQVDAEVITLMTKRLLRTWDYPIDNNRQLGTQLVARFRSFSWPVRRPFYHRRKASLAN
ncbi:MAG: hypothetical protein A2Z16_04885 [Chloroflexi bacterium RBG_16_54_18]|nr:MAG: hypothetical protein A2Z16_04885 [Chloroflexi bacterium RBG_16_54_18]